MHKLHETAGTVTALSDFTAVGVEDAVAEVDRGVGWRLDQQQLVAADAGMSVGQAADRGRVQRDLLAHAVDDDEVVTETVHLAEAERHVRKVRAPRRGCKPAYSARALSADHEVAVADDHHVEPIEFDTMC